MSFSHCLHCILGIASFALSFILSGCIPFADIASNYEGSIGTTSHGMLIKACTLPEKSSYYKLYRKFNRRFGTQDLVLLLENASKKVAKRYPGSRLLIGDLSAYTGGFISEHHSHRTGRDADIAFFSTNSKKKENSGAPLPKFDMFGVGFKSNKLAFFDLPRNWEFVESLLTDNNAQIQWIFVSKGLKALLIEWALLNNKKLSIIEQAASVLHQPSDSAPHDDHFHIRIYCPKKKQGNACKNIGPVWPWIDKHWQKSKPMLSDKQLLALALEDFISS